MKAAITALTLLLSLVLLTPSLTSAQPLYPTVQLRADPSLHIDPHQLSTAQEMLSLWLEQQVAPSWPLPAYPLILTLAPTIPCDGGATGCHKAMDGLPMGWVRVQPYAWSESTLQAVSHELVEMVADPLLNQAVTGLCTICSPYQPATFLEETADPVSTTLIPFTYRHHTYWLADFVYRAYFDGNGSWPYDAASVIRGPLRPVLGGYQDVLLAGHGWQELMGSDRRACHQPLTF